MPSGTNNAKQRQRQQSGRAGNWNSWLFVARHGVGWWVVELECWSDEVLQHSITPLLHHSVLLVLFRLHFFSAVIDRRYNYNFPAPHCALRLRGFRSISAAPGTLLAPTHRKMPAGAAAVPARPVVRFIIRDIRPPNFFNIRSSNP